MINQIIFEKLFFEKKIISDIKNYSLTVGFKFKLNT